MKKIKLMVSLLVAVSALALNSIGANAEWKQDKLGYWYTNQESYNKGWKLLDQNWYYFYSNNGYMAHDAIIDGYYLNSSGAWSNLPSANAESDFVFDEATGEIKEYVGTSTTAVIPSSINGVKVTKLGHHAFNINKKGKFFGDENKNIERVIIPEGVTSIGIGAFEFCPNLTSVVIPDSVTSIGEWAFESCSNLRNITIPNGVTVIPYCAFSNCSSLTSVIIPSSVKEIGMAAFSGCSGLIGIKLPSVESIKSGAFDGCNDATFYVEDDSLKKWLINPLGVEESKVVLVTSSNTDSINNNTREAIITTKNIVDESGVQFDVNTGKIVAYRGINTELDIPSKINGVNVTSIGDSAFSLNSKLTSITIPNSITSIGNQSFNFCTSVKNVTIPNSVTSIGKGAFTGCHSLTSITIPNSVTSIGDSAFLGCSNLEFHVENEKTKELLINSGVDKSKIIL